MKKMLMTLLLLLLLLLPLSGTGHCRTVVFFIGGWGMTSEQMDSLSSSVPDSIKVKFLLPAELSQLVRPWHCADLVYENMKKNNLLEENLVIVSFSLGGIVTQWLLKAHPELSVKKLVMVASPIGGYKFVPPNNFFSNNFPDKLPVYVIAGNKSQDAWFLRKENDGVVDLDSALDISDEHLKDAVIFNANHAELLKLPEVKAQIARWLDLGQAPADNLVADNSIRMYNSASSPNSTFPSNKLPN